MKRPVRHRHEPGPHPVAAVGRHDPALFAGTPVDGGDLGLEARVVVQVVVLGDRPAVSEDLTGARVLLLRDVAELFEEREIDVRLDVAHRAGIAIPVPRAAEVAALLDQPDVLHAAFAEPCTGEQPAEAASDHDDVGVVGQRLPVECAVDVGVIDEVREVACDFGVLLVAVLADTLVPLAAVLVA